MSEEEFMEMADVVHSDRAHTMLEGIQKHGHGAVMIDNQSKFDVVEFVSEPFLFSKENYNKKIEGVDELWDGEWVVETRSWFRVQRQKDFFWPSDMIVVVPIRQIVAPELQLLNIDEVNKIQNPGQYKVLDQMLILKMARKLKTDDKQMILNAIKSIEKLDYEYDISDKALFSDIYFISIY